MTSEATSASHLPKTRSTAQTQTAHSPSHVGFSHEPTDPNPHKATRNTISDSLAATPHRRTARTPQIIQITTPVPPSKAREQNTLKPLPRSTIRIAHRISNVKQNRIDVSHTDASHSSQKFKTKVKKKKRTTVTLLAQTHTHTHTLPQTHENTQGNRASRPPSEKPSTRRLRTSRESTSRKGTL